MALGWESETSRWSLVVSRWPFEFYVQLSRRPVLFITALLFAFRYEGLTRICHGQFLSRFEDLETSD